VRVYFDYNATTPLAPEVMDAVATATRDVFGNASSVHHFGQQAKAALDDARSAVAALIDADPSEVVFTSGGTESDNFAIRGAAEAQEPSGRRHLIASAIEHEAVLNTLKALGRRGWRTTLLPVEPSGIVSPDRLRDAIDGDTAVVSVMHANNEIGTIQPIAALAAIAHEHRALFHTDAVQSVGKIPVDVRALGADLLSLSAHKLGGPAGIGALWVRRGVELAAQTTGGSQERGRRAGTENVAAIVGFGVAAARARAELAANAAAAARLVERLWTGLRTRLPGVVLNGSADGPRLPNTLNVSFPGAAGESLLVLLDLAGVAVSLGSACAAGAAEPSHVLLAMGRDRDAARSGVRFSVGPSTTAADIDRVLELLPALVAQARGEAAA